MKSKSPQKEKMRTRLESGLPETILNVFVNKKVVAELMFDPQFLQLQASLVHLNLHGHSKSHNFHSSLNSSRCDSHAWYCRVPGDPQVGKTLFSDYDIMISDKEECWQHQTCSYRLCSEIRALDT